MVDPTATDSGGRGQSHTARQVIIMTMYTVSFMPLSPVMTVTRRVMSNRPILVLPARVDFQFCQAILES